MIQVSAKVDTSMRHRKNRLPAPRAVHKINEKKNQRKFFSSFFFNNVCRQSLESRNRFSISISVQTPLLWKGFLCVLTIVSDRIIIWRSLHHRPDFSFGEGLDTYSELLHNFGIGCKGTIGHGLNSICWFRLDGGGKVWGRACGVAVERVSLHGGVDLVGVGGE